MTRYIGDVLPEFYDDRRADDWEAMTVLKDYTGEPWPGGHKNVTRWVHASGRIWTVDVNGWRSLKYHRSLVGVNEYGGRKTIVTCSPERLPQPGYGTGRVRDFQRRRVYNSELVFKQGHPLADKYQTKEEVTLFVSMVYEDEWFIRQYGRRSLPSIRFPSRGRAAYATGTHLLSLPEWAWTDLIILHEISHLILDADPTPTATHGPEFCRIFLDCVRRFMGDVAAIILASNMHGNKVKVAATYQYIPNK